MTEKTLTCIVCPRGCKLTVTIGGAEPHIVGCACEKGRKWAADEILCPVRVLTSNVVIKGSDFELLSVKSSAPLPFETLAAALEELKTVTLQAPVKCGDVIIKGVAGTDIDIVATRSS